MELNNEFEVGVPLPEAWEVLTDLERIAPCMPGAELREIEGDEYRGVVKVKVGPIRAEYHGAARFLEREDSTHRAMLRAEGREARGQGNANATIIASLEPSRKGTKVRVTTDLQITGKVAQFGRGVLADVSNRLLGQFVDNLEATVLSVETGFSEIDSAHLRDPGPTQSPAGPSQEAAAPLLDTEGASRSRISDNGSAVRQIPSRPAAPVDLVNVAGAPIVRRVLPALAGAAAIVIALALVRRLLKGGSDS